MAHNDDSLARTTEWQSVLHQTRGNAVLARQILSLLAEELPGQCAEFELLLKRQAWTDAANIIHKILGSASFCGLISLKSTCSILETQLRVPAPPAPQILDTFRHETNRLLALLGRMSHRQ